MADGRSSFQTLAKAKHFNALIAESAHIQLGDKLDQSLAQIAIGKIDYTQIKASLRQLILLIEKISTIISVFDESSAELKVFALLLQWLIDAISKGYGVHTNSKSFSSLEEVSSTLEKYVYRCLITNIENICTALQKMQLNVKDFDTEKEFELAWEDYFSTRQIELGNFRHACAETSVIHNDLLHCSDLFSYISEISPLLNPNEAILDSLQTNINNYQQKINCLTVFKTMFTSFCEDYAHINIDANLTKNDRKKLQTLFALNDYIKTFSKNSDLPEGAFQETVCYLLASHFSSNSRPLIDPTFGIEELQIDHENKTIHIAPTTLAASADTSTTTTSLSETPELLTVEANESLSIQSLPIENLVNIFCFLSAKELAQISLVNKQFYNVAQEILQRRLQDAEVVLQILEKLSAIQAVKFLAYYRQSKAYQRLENKCNPSLVVNLTTKAPSSNIAPTAAEILCYAMACQDSTVSKITALQLKHAREEYFYTIKSQALKTIMIHFFSMKTNEIHDLYKKMMNPALMSFQNLYQELGVTSEQVDFLITNYLKHTHELSSQSNDNFSLNKSADTFILLFANYICGNAKTNEEILEKIKQFVAGIENNPGLYDRPELFINNIYFVPELKRNSLQFLFKYARECFNFFCLSILDTSFDLMIVAKYLRVLPRFQNEFMYAIDKKRSLKSVLQLLNGEIVKQLSFPHNKIINLSANIFSFSKNKKTCSVALDLSGIIWNHSLIENLNLSYANFTANDFSNCHLFGCDLSGDFTDTNFTNACIINSQFTFVNTDSSALTKAQQYHVIALCIYFREHPRFNAMGFDKLKKGEYVINNNGDVSIAINQSRNPDTVISFPKSYFLNFKKLSAILVRVKQNCIINAECKLGFAKLFIQVIRESGISNKQALRLVSVALSKPIFEKENIKFEALHPSVTQVGLHKPQNQPTQQTDAVSLLEEYYNELSAQIADAEEANADTKRLRKC